MRIDVFLVSCLAVGCLRGTAVPADPTPTDNPDPTRVECPTGFVDVKGVCEDIDECVDSPCDENATCTNLDGTFECDCTQGYEGDGTTTCRDIDGCASNPCAQGADPMAICTDVPAPGIGHTCECSSNSFVDASGSCDLCNTPIEGLMPLPPTVSCIGEGDCEGQTVNCPSDRDCMVECLSRDSCPSLTVECDPGFRCITVCEASDACSSVQIEANDAFVRVQCEASDSCEGLRVNCSKSTSACRVDCAAPDACAAAEFVCDGGPCHLRCSEAGCDGMTLTCGPGGCSVTGSGRDGADRSCPPEGCTCFDPVMLP
ncbi:MAG: calcium-binding EGF-like domain-containing protein [Myxococcota bacterium]